MSYETIDLTVAENGVATVLLNRPDSRNALNVKMCAELVQVTEQIEQEENIRVVIFRGAGTAFCAGADLKERKDMSLSDMTARRVAGFAAYDAIEKLTRPAVALVHGPAFGSGCEIIAACDFAWSTPEATFRYPEVSWGTVGATQRISRIAGIRVAKELLFSGRVFDAQEAREFGLINRIVPKDDIQTQLMEMAGKIAEARPLTVKLTKQSINAGVETSREGAMAIELLAIEKNLRHSDWKSAISSFGNAKEKR